MKQKKILPPTYLFMALVAMAALHFVLPLRKIIPWPYHFVGVLLLAIGSVINVWSSNLFAKYETTVKPFEPAEGLVTQGPFRVSRHPMYLGMVLILAGCAVLLRSLTPFFVIPVFAWLMDTKFIRVEEEMMEESHGDAYREYKKRVRRWI